MLLQYYLCPYTILFFDQDVASIKGRAREYNIIRSVNETSELDAAATITSLVLLRTASIMAIRIFNRDAAQTSKQVHQFHIELITRRFYDRFKLEHAAFQASITGIPADTDRARYASLLLLRLMFLCFMQKKGFLANDINYLPNCLRLLQGRQSRDSSLSFYRHFLLPLFHEGLSKQEHRPELTTLLGKVPFLNSRLFSRHQLEYDYPGIHIPDQAFGRIFDFFDDYQWRSDDGPPGAENEINPGVLGYIFEKYLNQKQVGAYYTRKDVTEYIARTTIIPFVLDAAAKACPGAFQPGGPLWRLLQDNPDRYIYPAVKKGSELPLPPALEAGLYDISQRCEWNTPAPADFALPTETWREVVARHEHYARLHARLRAGEVHTINELITYNLDIRQFAQDVIEHCTEPELLQALYGSISQVTILDPTCGPGAFLFAALDILEPLYSTCFERLTHLYYGEKEGAWIGLAPSLRTDVHNQRYHILKTIIANNLYGVDIMEEAVAICKLRLFLKLITEVERIEDIEPLSINNSNIRTGNALLGSACKVETRHGIEQQSTFEGNTKQADIDHTAFHWHVEFPRIMQNGGFDVIIGNPPYIEYEKINSPYQAQNYQTLSTGNLYALTMERSAQLLAAAGRFGMIVPSSATCTDGYLPLQKILLEQSALHISSYSDQRGKLFAIPHPRLCIITYQKRPDPRSVFSTSYLKPGRELRDYLFQRLAYVEVTNQVRPGVIPRYGSRLERTLHNKLYSQAHHLGDYVCPTGDHSIYYTRKLSWFVQVTPFIPKILDEQGNIRHPSELKMLRFSSPVHADIAFVALNSNLFYWFVTTGSDCRNLNMREVLGLPLSIDEIAQSAQGALRKLAAKLAADLQEHAEMRQMSFKAMGALTIQCIFPGRSKAIIDEIDGLLAEHYGFTEEELDFIINYDSKYRAM